MAQTLRALATRRPVTNGRRHTCRPRISIHLSHRKHRTHPVLTPRTALFLRACGKNPRAGPKVFFIASDIFPRGRPRSGPERAAADFRRARVSHAYA